MDNFLTKYVRESNDFFVKNREGHHIDFFGPQYTVVLTELALFDLLWAQGGFHEKVEKQWHESTDFLRE